MSSTFLILLLSLPYLSAAFSYPRNHPPNTFHARSNSRNVPPQGFYDPTDHGGSYLTQVNNTFPVGLVLGEPINAIILGSSDDAVLQDQQQNGGLRNYFLSFGFAAECLGSHSGSDQAANLGDGHGYLNETAVIRWDYGDPTVGTCKETIEGGNHFRYWIQNGNDANSGAIFMAVSYELPSSLEHDIIFNGYNLARDWLIGNATAQSQLIPSSNLTNQTTYSGQTSFGGYVYETNVQYVSGLLPNGSDGINHFGSVGANGTSAVDGLTALMSVKILQGPVGATKSSSGQAPRLSWSYFALSLTLGSFVLSLVPSVL
ncbi:hypothetical protein FA95DRAFT_1566747 [Auriscalpium vulgare]|uniref:Uncharacterized protein n=1 Tax=Auriscalpium vulgare TaxID=40419 RepID=A0ACB8R831_9AGAM|nr:hypothetical protein FA95DRAFT_1566747 [Auriscalpium vulgare]